MPSPHKAILFAQPMPNNLDYLRSRRGPAAGGEMSRDRHESLHEWDAPLAVRIQLADEYLLSIEHSHIISADHAERSQMAEWHNLQANIARNARITLTELEAQRRES